MTARASKGASSIQMAIIIFEVLFRSQLWLPNNRVSPSRFWNDVFCEQSSLFNASVKLCNPTLLLFHIKEINMPTNAYITHLKCSVKMCTVFGVVCLACCQHWRDCWTAVHTLHRVWLQMNLFSMHSTVQCALGNPWRIGSWRIGWCIFQVWEQKQTREEVFRYAI